MLAGVFILGSVSGTNLRLQPWQKYRCTPFGAPKRMVFGELQYLHMVGLSIMPIAYRKVVTRAIYGAVSHALYCIVITDETDIVLKNAVVQFAEIEEHDTR